jgi:3-methyladenine DNA glycosylase AlkD
MKSELRFHGVTQKDIRQAAREAWKQPPKLDHEALRALVDALFSEGSFDLRSVAIGILERKPAIALLARLGGHGSRGDDLDWLVGLVRDASCWAHVDWLAVKVIGAVLVAHPEESERIRAWAKDPDLWVRRTALLAELDALKAGRGDFARFTEIAVPMLGVRDFWIRKALGWVLREVSKKRPELVRAFVDEHGDTMSGLTRREATKYLAPE